MKYIYTAYIKLINDKEFFFVKKIVHFPEMPNTTPVLENYGMHTDFNKACNIAGIYDIDLKNDIYKQIDSTFIYGQKNVTPVLSKKLSVSIINNKTSLVSKLSGFKKLLSSKFPHWRILYHS